MRCNLNVREHSLQGNKRNRLNRLLLRHEHERRKTRKGLSWRPFFEVSTRMELKSFLSPVLDFRGRSKARSRGTFLSFSLSGFRRRFVRVDGRLVVRTSIDSYNGDEPINAEQINIWKCGGFETGTRNACANRGENQENSSVALNTIYARAKFRKNELEAEIRARIRQRRAFTRFSFGKNTKPQR